MRALTCATWISSRRVLVVGLCFLALGLGSADRAGANPMPSEACLVNIGPAPFEVRLCQDIVQHTDQTGQLTFTAYYYPLYVSWGTDVGVWNLTAEFWWPSAWSLVGAQPPMEGDGTLIPLGADRYRLEWTWPLCPRFAPYLGEALPIARFVLDVTGEGKFQCLTTDGALCYPPGAVMYGGAWGQAHAGVRCSYCDVNCNLANGEQPNVEPALLSLEASAGQRANGTLHVWLDGSPDVVYAAAADWLSFEEVWISPVERELLVTADAAGLDSGTYETYLSATVECRTCARVLFTVLPGAQGVEEDGRVDETVVPASWGSMKKLRLEP